MKTASLFLTVLLTIGLNVTSYSQSHDQNKSSQTSSKTESFKVWGKCDMCKERIEKTVKAEGATKAEWNEKSQLLTVAFDPSKTNIDGLSKKLASVGHDTEKYKADDKVYEALPGCCHYDRSK
jgi:periplasmic mercuric ion binding protein